MKKIIFILIFLFAPIVILGIDDVYSRETLRGLKGFGVIIYVNGIDELSEEQVRMDTELKLKMAGIIAIDTDDMNSIRDAIFKVEVIGFETSDRRNYSFGIRIEVRQYGSFKASGRRGFVGDVETWSLWTVGLVRKSETDFIRNTINDYVDMFINSYFSVNPK